MTGKSGRFSKSKGSRFERDLAKELRFYGYDARRTAQYCGKTGDAADLIGLPKIHIEAKHQERMRLYDWYEQSVRDTGDSGDIPVVMHKANCRPILVSLSLEDFMTIYREWEAGLDTAGKSS